MDPSRGVFFILSTRRDRARMRIRITESVTASAGAVEGASCKKSFARSMEGPISLVSFAAGIGMSVRMALMAQSWFLGLHNRNGKIRNTVIAVHLPADAARADSPSMRRIHGCRNV